MHSEWTERIAVKECSYSPQRQNKSILSFLAPPYQHRPRPRSCWITTLGRALQWDSLAPSPITDINFPSPHPSPPKPFETRKPDRRVCGQRREWPRVRTAACWSWITSPVAKCVYGLCAFAEVFFSVLTLYSPRSIVCFLFFFPHFPCVML